MKNRYPFRLGTTSFIHPAGYVSNVRQLAPFLDEIELLLLESMHLPSPGDIRELHALAQTHDITFNVHLPMDIDLAADAPATRRQSIEAIATTVGRIAPLHPTTQTLHLNYSSADKSGDNVEAWQNRALESMARLIRTTGIDAGKFSIETLDFPPSWLTPIVASLNLSVCVDIGHVILHGFDLAKVFESFAARTTMLHLHGVAAGRDHLAVSHLKPDDRMTVSRYLQNFKGSLSIEVFSLEQLKESMAVFPGLMNVAKGGSGQERNGT